jgi:hypothetical protein
MRYMQLLKSFNASNQSGKMWSVGWMAQEMGQHPMAAPTVFNFFLPTYAPSGPISDSSLVAPEFELLNSANSIKYINLIADMCFGGIYMESITMAHPDDIGIPWWGVGINSPEDNVTLDFEDEIILASNDVQAMVDRLNILLAGGTASSETLDTISTLIDVEGIAPADRVKVALYLLLISPDYIIQK